MAEGWTYLINSKKWHYFRDGRSLCGKWAYFGSSDFEKGKDNHPKNCSACVKKRAAETNKTSKALSV